MIPIQITPNIELDPWSELRDLVATGDLITDLNGPSATIERVGLLPNGTRSGRAVVMFQVRLPDGRVVLAETTLRLFRGVAAALLASPVAQLDEL